MSKWTDVNESMPKRQHWTECGSVWVFVKQDGKAIDDECQYDYTSEKWRDRALYFVENVTHWKPLHKGMSQ